jgi:hypothetical protein
VPTVPALRHGLGKVIVSGGGDPTVMLKVPLVPGVVLPKGVTWTVKVNVPCFVGVPPTIVPAAP